MTTTETAHALSCPCCGQIDRTERVTAAYRAGLATDAGAGAAATFDHGLVPTPTVFGMGSVR